MSKTILVVDDDKLVRQSLASVLTTKGFTVEIASNGREGLQKATEKSVDLVVTDLRMPEMDGLQLVEALRKNEKTKKVPVIVMTVDEETTSLNQALAAGVTVYLSKSSLDAETLANQIVTAL